MARSRPTVAVSVLLLSAACTYDPPRQEEAEPAVEAEREPREPGGPPPEPEGGTPDLGFDPIDPVAGLAVTAASDHLVVSTVGDDVAPLLLIDLADDRVTPVPSGIERPSASFSGDVLGYSLGARTLGMRHVDEPDVVSQVDLPAEVPGAIRFISGDESGFVVVVQDPLDPADPTGRGEVSAHVAFGPDGELRCVVDDLAEPDSIDLSDGALWHDGLSRRVDLADCSRGPGLIDAVSGWIIGSVPDGLVVGGGSTISVHDEATGALVRASAPLGDFVWMVEVALGSIWAMVDGDLLRIDPETLEVVHRAGPSLCGSTGFVVAGEGSLWLFDDCSGMVSEVDPVTGDFIESWWLPHDNASDMEIGGVVTGDGMWLVDVEQTGEPYRFDFARRRFERMPISRDAAGPIYAMEFDCQDPVPV